MPDLAHILKLPAYGPHSGAPYEATSTTPGTVDPALPTETTQNDTPDVGHGAQRIADRRGFESLLDALFRVVHDAGYETAGPYTIGGKSQTSLAQVANATGLGSIYTLANPFDSDGEYCIISAAFGAAGQAILSKDPYTIGPSLSAFYDGGSQVRGVPFFAAGVQTFIMGTEVWYPLPASDSVFWAVNMAAANTSSALVTLAFRRRITRHGRYLLTQE